MDFIKMRVNVEWRAAANGTLRTTCSRHLLDISVLFLVRPLLVFTLSWYKHDKEVTVTCFIMHELGQLNLYPPRNRCNCISISNYLMCTYGRFGFILKTQIHLRHVVWNNLWNSDRLCSVVGNCNDPAWERVKRRE